VVLVKQILLTAMFLAKYVQLDTLKVYIQSSALHALQDMKQLLQVILQLVQHVPNHLVLAIVLKLVT